MSIGEILLVVFIVGVPVSAIVPAILIRRKQRRYAYFRLIDEKTKQPISEADVYLYALHQAGAATTANAFAGGPTTTHEKFGHLGVLDPDGCFRHVFSLNSGAILIKAPGIVSGLLAPEVVSDLGKFPKEPYLCVVRLGMVAAPTKRSGVSLGLAPGAEEQATTGYVNIYERPEKDEEYIGWPTLEEAKANTFSDPAFRRDETNKRAGSMAHYWLVRGPRRGPAIGGNSFMIAAEHVERVHEGAENKGRKKGRKTEDEDAAV